MIFHVDMDAFFASIEIVRNPSLRGKPVIVGGSPEKRGVVSTCSYEARQYGVHSAMSAAEAKRLCPQGIFLSGSYSLYGEISKTIMQIFREVTPYVQVMSIDEAYLDVSHRVQDEKETKQLASMLHKKIYEVTQLTCSIGIASNKMMAKIGSNHAKPNGLCYIPAGTEKTFLFPLSIEILPGIGKKTVKIFLENGMHTLGDIQRCSLEQLTNRFGNWGYDLYYLVRGEDDRPVRWLPRLPKSISEETTFAKDSNDTDFLLETVENLVEEVTERLQRKKMRARGIAIKIRDARFRTFTRSRTLFTHTQSADVLQEEFRDLFLHSYPQGMWVRLLGATVERLTKEAWQPTLWNWEREPPLPPPILP